jgi:hypothetical protein
MDANSTLILRLKEGVVFTTTQPQMNCYGTVFSIGRHFPNRDLFYLNEVNPLNTKQKLPVLQICNLVFGKDEIELVDRRNSIIHIRYENLQII